MPEQTTQTVVIDTTRREKLSPLVFGHNLEHTRACMAGGLSAQMLRNRKFAGKPSKNEGCAADWFPIGRRAYFQTNVRSYARHAEPDKMPRRNELGAQDIQNLLPGDECGFGQHGLCLEAGRAYELRVAARAPQALKLSVRLTDRAGQTVYAEKTVDWPRGDWHTERLTLVPAQSDADADLRVTFTDGARLTVGALSLMPEDNFHGMRRDVVAALKVIGASLLRWPGGNFAGEYRWKDGLLDPDERAPMQSCMEIETQPYTHGYDNHDIDTDDFIALCREIGAEPFITVNLFWDSPEDCAQWVEYCNGGETTEWGRKRIERGHREPYNVRLWSLGNEMGYGHMEGPMTPEAYTEMASARAEAMRRVSPDLELFASGPYPNESWAERSARPLEDTAPNVSLHFYPNCEPDYSSPEAFEATAASVLSAVERGRALIRKTRAQLGERTHISFDEWNCWYEWYRPSSVLTGLFAAGMLHMMSRESIASDLSVCCYFQPVGEGAMIIRPGHETELTAIGQAFEFLLPHRGAFLCPMTGCGDDALATVDQTGRALTVTLVNGSLGGEKSVCVKTGLSHAVLTDARLLTSDDALPYSRFKPSPADAESENGAARLTLPPRSLARLTFAL